MDQISLDGSGSMDGKLCRHVVCKSTVELIFSYLALRVVGHVKLGSAWLYNNSSQPLVKVDVWKLSRSGAERCWSLGLNRNPLGYSGCLSEVVVPMEPLQSYIEAVY